MELISQIFLTSIIVLFLDSIWIGLIANSMYKTNFVKTQRSPFKVKPLGAFISYILLISSIIYFGVLSSNPLLNGALIGLFIYGIYNSVNYATLSNYSLKVSIIDTLWGTLLSSVTALIVSQISNNTF